VGLQGEEASRRETLGWLATALVAVLAVVVGVGAWAADATARAAQGLSVSALRSVELAEEMRWQLGQLNPGYSGFILLDPSAAQALLRLQRDVRAYEQLATSDEEQRRVVEAVQAQPGAGGRLVARGWRGGVAGRGERVRIRRAADRPQPRRGGRPGKQDRRPRKLPVRCSTPWPRRWPSSSLPSWPAHGSVALERERSAIARTLGNVEDKNRELEAFAGTVAHDLRSPLTPVQALASLLARGGQGDGDVRRLAGRIVASTSARCRI
jgi:signal transduction histidine kinase